MITGYKCDVAFSFLQRDEQLAKEIADRLRERIDVFIYSEQQKELIANDGVDSFSQVLRKAARVVVVLYRGSWGETRWTRVEETAIKSRYLDEGFKFVVVVSLDGKKPIWYPDSWIWGDFERLGIDGLASVVEARVRDVGEIVNNHSAVDEAAHLRNEIVFDSKRSHWRNSTEGYLAAREELKILFVELQRLAKDISDKSLEVAIEFRNDGETVCQLYSRGFQLQLVWHSRFGNTLSESKLYIKIIEAYRMMDYVIESGGPKILRDIRYDADLSKAGTAGWRQTTLNGHFFTSFQLADFLLKELIGEIRKPQIGVSKLD